MSSDMRRREAAGVKDPAGSAFQALKAGDVDTARRQAILAAEAAFTSAEQANGQRRRNLVEEGERWLCLVAEIADRKSSSSSTPSNGKPAWESDGKDSLPANDWQIQERPEDRLSDLAGLEEAKSAIEQMILLPLARPDWAQALKLPSGGGVLLYGPPGNGKTLLGRAIAGELDVPFYYASGAQIRSKWHGESEQRLRQLMQTVKDQKQAVLFLDEVDGLLPRRSGKSVVDNRLVTQFLAELGGFEESGNTTLLLGATNCPWEIDDAVFRTGRFDVKIYVGVPDREARTQILRMHLDLPEAEVSVDTEVWADRLEGYCGSDLVGIIQAAKRQALARAVESGKAPSLVDEDVASAVTLISPSANQHLLARYETFKQAR